MINFPSFEQNYKCPICEGKVFRCSKALLIDKKTKIDWINDSSFELSELKEATSYLTTCFRCFHSLLVPYYDVSKLYQPKLGFEVRKKYYENYFPEKIYGEKSGLSTNLNIFEKSSKELHRFQKNINLMSKLFKFDQMIYEEFSILDYGGGDGYISSIFSKVFGAILDKKVDFCIYDFTQWKNSEGKFLDRKINKKFDLIILSHVLEHNHNPTGLLNEVIKYANQDSIIYIEVPDQRYVLLKGLLGKRFGMNYHVSYFSKTSLQKLFNKCGITMHQCFYDFSGSYRGDDLETIVAVGRVNKIYKKKKKIKINTLIYELLSTFFSVYIKLIRNIKKNIH